MLKKVAHHIRNTRPQWYHEYHEWRYHGILHWVTFVVSCIIILIGFVNVLVQFNQNKIIDQASAATDETVVTQEVTSGTLQISNSGDESLTSTQTSITHQDTTGDLGVITFTDDRGTGDGWSATAESTDFYKYNNPTTTNGSNTVILGTSTAYATSSADTDMDTSDVYIITIDTPGDVGTATFDVTGAEIVSDVTTGTGDDIAIGTKGLKVDFNDSGYLNGDQWKIRVDTIPVTGFMLTPGSLTTISGDNANVTPGSTQFFSDPDYNDSFMTTLITMPLSLGWGMGSYSINPTLQLGVPSNSYANTYTATVTETIQ